MSDNALLAFLGAVGIGALVMGMKQEEVKEDWWGGGSIAFTTENRQIEVEVDKNGIIKCERELPQNINRGIQTIAQQGIQQTMQAMQVAQSVSLEEGYQAPHSNLGSGQVTPDYYVSYPQHEHSVTQPSPSLGLPAVVRYSLPDHSTMGLTDQFDCNTITEGWQVPESALNPSLPPGFVAGRNYNQASMAKTASENSLASRAHELGKVVKKGTAASDGSNVMIFDRNITVPGKSAGRFNRGNGIVDRIRGDLPVCVDPCQKGWFASPGNPSQLAQGALSMIGGAGEQANSVANMASLYGKTLALMPASGSSNPSVSIIGLTAPSSGTVSADTRYAQRQ